MRCAVRLTRHEISPRFAIKILSKSGFEDAAAAEAEAEADDDEEEAAEAEDKVGVGVGGAAAAEDEEVEACAAPATTAGRRGGRPKGLELVVGVRSRGRRGAGGSRLRGAARQLHRGGGIANGAGVVLRHAISENFGVAAGL